jgi:hypothetical protein
LVHVVFGSLLTTFFSQYVSTFKLREKATLQQKEVIIFLISPHSFMYSKG